jgi:hypothetical protein
MAPINPAVAAFLLAAAASGLAQEVQVRLINDRLLFSAPGLHFISGKPLEQLRNGNSVAFDVQVSLLTDNRQTVLRRSFERFVLSYDVWEEKFSVTRMRSTGSAASHLTGRAAEAWCLDRFALVTAGLPVDRPIWARIDVRAAEGRDRASGSDDDALSLATLIDLLSRPGKPRGTSQWRVESAPFQIASLRRNSN